MLIHSTPEGKTVKTKGVLRTRQPSALIFLWG